MDLGFEMPFFSKGNQGSLEKWLIPGLEHLGCQKVRNCLKEKEMGHVRRYLREHSMASKNLSYAVNNDSIGL